MERPKILCIHGIGGKDKTMDIPSEWAFKWRDGLKTHLGIVDDQNIIFMKFDSYFDNQNAGVVDYGKFIVKTFLDFLKRRKSQKMYSVKDWMDDYPDMVVEYLQHPKLKRKLWDDLRNHIETHKPDIIYAHSLGSIMCYEFFIQPENKDKYKDITLVTAGSQLGNNLMSAHTTFPIVQLPIKKWYNLNNRKDLVLAGVRISANYPNFKHIDTYFDDNGPANHDGLRYLNHEKAVSEVWKLLR
ncbi:hypothetical protein [Sphingobacterium sp. IITKGP-BTPF85]|uniref:hypothetical protein n=1 Tax=Sphingobacterium sp. IITKGP-BTPF85 TaxID=1338009 RepID=UPI00038A42F3|nr:hypothetical protein [Sphingobacterium sp. IITKGP-BTPF85]KKX46791.1 hypothetical protein L950_0229975 [Sphingobacterium sp. IITKGP-BTPF85]